MPLTKDELLKPRIKCVIDYPSNIFGINKSLLFTNKADSEFSFSEEWFFIKDGVAWGKTFFDQYPLLFQPLPWWSDRRPEDMPEYLEWPDTGVVCKPSKYIGQYFYLSDDDSFGYNLAHVNIATEEEYNAYINQK